MDHSVEVRFCSLQCWRKGRTGSHRLECGLATDLAVILGQVKGGAAPPEYYRLCLEVIGARTVEEVVQVNIDQEVDMSQVPSQREGQLESLLRLVSVDDQRSLETDFWIFLTVSFFVAFLDQKNFFTDTKLSVDQVNNRRNTNLTPQQLKVGAFLTRILRVSKLLNSSCTYTVHIYVNLSHRIVVIHQVVKLLICIVYSVYMPSTYNQY